MLLALLIGIFVVGLASQFAALYLGSRFRSAEKKEGQYRVGGGQGTSSKLPMTGGPALIITLIAGGAAASTVLPGWEGLWKPAVAVVGFGLVGFIDDWGKHQGRGLSQRFKSIGCIVVACLAAAVLVYAPGSAFPIWRWLASSVFLFSIAVAADFSDGIDGLSAGLGLIAALGMAAACAVAIRVFGTQAFLLFAAALLSLYLFNLPSAWSSRQASSIRRARVYLGDSGALALGGGLAALALWTRMGWIFLPAAGVWILEGFSSGWQAEFLTKLLYRKRGIVERYGNEWAPHVEFPLPLLAAPLHHHFELAGWNRMQVVLLFYAVALLCALGAAMTAGLGVWLIVGCAVAAWALVALWSLAGLFRTNFLAVGESGTLVMNSGVPFRLGPWRYYRTVRNTGLSVLTLTPDERMWLYRPMARVDTVEILVRLLHGHGRHEESEAAASALPLAARRMRLADCQSEPKG